MSESQAEYRTDGYMFDNVVEKGLTYGQAMDKAIHEGKKVTLPHWKGYWEMRHVSGISAPVLIAVLRDNAGTTTATPYAEDKLSKEWMVVE